MPTHSTGTPPGHTPDTPGRRASVALVRERVGRVADPEIPVVTLADLGILRGVEERGGRLTVTLTPTYSGCPATEAIADDVRQVLAELGHADAQVCLTLTPAWTTDWIKPEAHEKLRAYGIAPPVGSCGAANDADRARPLRFQPRPARLCCPQCGSDQVSVVSEFGSTPCKALYRCLRCAEPFDYFKPF